MGFQTLGLTSIPRPAAPVRVAAAATAAKIGPDMLERGTTGTAIFGRGYIRELGEYNPEFSGGPFSAYRTWEKMRRSDAQVAATVMAQKLPVRCAEWAVVPPEDPTPTEQECAEFVEDVLFDDIDFDRMLENLLLAIEFGSACHEDIWTITNGQVRLKKAAARLPLTFYNWIPDEQEDLAALVQHGFHGGSFGEFVLPADKIALYVFQQEGANFAGRSLLRAMYQSWYTKAALYKIDAIAAERNGMGVPVGKLGPSASAEDRKQFEMFLRQLAAHESAFVMMPDGYEFSLKGVEGQLRSPWDSIQHHNTQISMAGLAQFMVMGQSHGGSGNRSLGETMSDFFYLSLQTLANQVGDCISDATVARLAAYNFGPPDQVRPPRLVPQQIMAIKFESVTTALASLGTANLLTPDPDLELWLRKKMGAPAIERAELVRLRQQTTSIPKIPADPAAEPGTGGDAGGAGKAEGAAGDGGATEPENDESGDSNGGAVAASEAKLRRAPRGVETCLAADEIVSRLDQGRDEVAAALRAARSRVQAEMVQKLIARPLQQAHRVSLELDRKLVTEVEQLLRGVYTFGSDQVAQERDRQLAGKTPADAQAVRAADVKPKGSGGTRAGDPIGLYADAVVSEFQNEMQARAARVALDLKRRQGDQTDGEVFRLAEAELDDQSSKWIDRVAAKGTNEAFAEGRSDGASEFDVSQVIYSALLDINTCEACAAADGETGETDEDITDTPNPDCDGGDQCRCVHVYVFADEGSVAA